ncbi:MAG: hypothetical protein RL711_345 [Bacteroidota bacterium]
MACGGKYLPRQYEKRVSKKDTTIFTTTNTATDSFRVQYLGCGGLLIQKGKDKIMVDPFFSNPSFGKVIRLGNIKADTNTIDQVFKTLAYQNTQTCLISHAHYDHLLDVPYISKHYFNHQWSIYGSETVINILKSKNLQPQYLHATDSLASNDNTLGTWTYTSKDSTCRFMPITYSHAPHVKLGFINMTFFKGNYHQQPRKLNKVQHWKEGQTMAYLIDFMQKDSILKRIYVLSGGASNAPIGFINDIPALQTKKIDLMVLCVASHEKVRQYPARIISAHTPHYIMGAHWEDFFTPYFDAGHKKAVRMTNVPQFFDKTDQLQYQNKLLMGKPLNTFTFVF